MEEVKKKEGKRSFPYQSGYVRHDTGNKWRDVDSEQLAENLMNWPLTVKVTGFVISVPWELVKK